MSMTVELPDYVNSKEFIGSNLNPVVVLTDFRKSLKKLSLETPPTTPLSQKQDSQIALRTSRASVKSKSDALLALSSSRSTTNPFLSTHKQSKSARRKRKSWDSSIEYEIEKIVGYHRDKQKKMWYLVKWKDWSHEYNTFEPIDNLTKCHYKLMQYFEVNSPSREELKKKNSEVKAALRQSDIYTKLVGGGYNADDLDEFSEKCLDLTPLFETSDLNDLENTMQTEYEYIIRCLIGMYSHQDPGLFLRAQNYKMFLKLVKLRRRQLQNNATAERLVNNLEKTLVTIENKVDLEVFPDIHYVLELSFGKGVVVPREPVLGCECPEGCSSRSQCCGKLADSSFAYGSNGRLRTSERIAIYECNSRCRCPATCTNRVVQRGRQVKLCIFRTRSCGWGVKALQKISKGTFVCQYVGELISDSEANVRDIAYMKEKRTGYLFDLDFFKDSQMDMYCIDATEQGNVARFINHSCDPNLVVYPVWIDCLEPNLHLLAFFAKRNIQKGEEIHFDYENLQDGVQEEGTEDDGKNRGVRMISYVRCQCNAPNCREWLFGNK